MVVPSFMVMMMLCGICGMVAVILRSEEAVVLLAGAGVNGVNDGIQVQCICQSLTDLGVVQGFYGAVENDVGITLPENMR